MEKNQVKDIVNKKGFTLVELLIVIALISVLLIIAMPNLIGIFSNSVKSTMKIQEQEIKDSSLLYLEDFCKNKLSGKTCPNSINRNDDNTYSGQISLQTLIDEEYIEEIEIQKTMYKEGKSYDELEEFLKENNKNNTLKVTNKDNKYIEFILESEIEFITPGLDKILGNPFYAKVRRVIYYE